MQSNSRGRYMTELDNLLIKVAKKDTQAFEILYNNTSPKLYTQCLCILNYNKETAEDVLQEAYIKIWNKAEKYKQHKGSAMSWMATIVRNQAFDRIRSYKHQAKIIEKLSNEIHDYVSSELSILDRKNHSDQIAYFKELLEKLPKIQQQAITQSLIYGYTHNEISEELNVPLGTVKSWMRRKLKPIRNQMSDYIKVTRQ